MSIVDINPVKQTDTTQRWKMKILGPATRLAVPTKIEFSRRGMKDGLDFNSVEPEIISAYRLYPILSKHYSLSAAFAQKVEALINRTETQARDVFDLHHLIELGAKGEDLPLEIRDQLEKATENLISISYDDYKSQVVSYLDVKYQKYFETNSKWTSMQERLMEVFHRANKGKKS